MKKFLLLCVSLVLLGSAASAQDGQLDETFQFVDEEGNVVPDGSVVVVKTINDKGEMTVPLYAKNTSGAKVAVSMYETIDAKPNGTWQTCAFGLCQIMEETGYGPKNIVAADYNEDIMTEWIPAEGGYATWEATLQIHVFATKKTISFGQTIETPTDEIIGYGPKVTVRFEYSAPVQTAKAWWGYVGADDSVSGLGVNAAETYDCASFYPGDNEMTTGKTIHAVRFAILSSNVKDVKVWIAESLPTNVGTDALRVVDVPSAKVGVNEIELSEPYTITDKGVYVGYTFTVSRLLTSEDAYPVAITGDAAKNMLILRTSSSVSSWGDQNNYGRLYLQLLLEGVFPHKNAVTTSDFGEYVASVGGKVQAYLPITNEGTADVSNIDYVITTDGVASPEQHLDLSSPISFGSTKVSTITLTGDATSGKRDKTLTITKVNGEPNETEAAAAFTVSTVSRVAPRGIAVEEFTGTGCGWCPRGLVGMEKMRNKFGDKFIGIGVHGYNNSDPMYFSWVTDYHSGIFSGSAPACQMNRSYGQIDPYYGTSDDIIDDFNNQLSLLPKATLEVTGEWNADSTQVDATATIEALVDGSYYTIEFMLIADSLTDTGSAWRQYNYYHQAYGNYSSKRDLPRDMQFLFNAGQVYNNQYAAYYPVFNDVLIASSYSNRVNQAVAPGTLSEGQTVKSTFTLTMPTKAALTKVIKKKNVAVVALLVSDDGTVANAAKFYLPGYNQQSAITTPSAQAGTTVQSRYGIDGRQLHGASRGLNIVRMADGIVRKVVVR